MLRAAKADSKALSGREADLRSARQMHAKAGIEFERIGDQKQADYHFAKAKSIYHKIHDS